LLDETITRHVLNST